MNVARGTSSGAELRTGIPLGLRCQYCKGAGSTIERPLDCHHGGCACPCDTADVDCSRCGATGREPCIACGKPSAGIAPDGDPHCDPCLVEIHDEERLAA